MNQLTADALTEFVKFLDSVLGFGLCKSENINNEQKLQINKRNEAREEKDFALADRIRNSLQEQGIEIKDISTGTLWRRA